MSRKIEIGPYSAYAIAVKYGYQGTEAEWVKAQEKARVESGQAAARAEAAAGQAEKARQETEAARDDAVQAITNSRDSALSDVETARSGALRDIGTSRAAAIQAVGTAQTAAVKAVSDEQTTALDSIQSAGSAALTGISDKKAEAVTAVEDAGQKTLSSIPEDYTEMSTRVTTLEQTKAVIDDTTVGPDAWSAKHLVDMLCPPVEETGNPVQVSDLVPGYPLGVTASWEPTQEGTGDPSPENIRPITGKDSVSVTRQEDGQTTTLTLPSTVYGGSVDAETGEGHTDWALITLTGDENWHLEGETFACNPGLGEYSKKRMLISHAVFSPDNPTANYRMQILGYSLYFYASTIKTSDEMKQYITSQYAAGTPVQLIYTLADPIPFTATGGAPLPALEGTNTVMTNADSLTVTARADPIKRITALEDAVASMTNNE